MYVEKTDYKRRITLELLNLLLQEDEEGILADASATAERTIRIKAGVLYDIAPELLKTGSDRDYYILSLAISIALYEIFNRADDEDVPKKVIKNYNDAITTLTEISLSKEPLDLPPKPADVTPTEPCISDNSETIKPEGNGLRRLGSQPRRSHIV